MEVSCDIEWALECISAMGGEKPEMSREYKELRRHFTKHRMKIEGDTVSFLYWRGMIESADYKLSYLNDAIERFKKLQAELMEKAHQLHRANLAAMTFNK